jgi:hypothetical protein
MRFQTTPNFAPDGMGTAQGAESASQTRESHDDNDTNNDEHGYYDDGLVHGHAWAEPAHTR